MSRSIQHYAANVNFAPGRRLDATPAKKVPKKMISRVLTEKEALALFDRMASPTAA